MHRKVIECKLIPFRRQNFSFLCLYTHLKSVLRIIDIWIMQAASCGPQTKHYIVRQHLSNERWFKDTEMRKGRSTLI